MSLTALSCVVQGFTIMCNASKTAKRSKERNIQKSSSDNGKCDESENKNDNFTVKSWNKTYE